MIYLGIICMMQTQRVERKTESMGNEGREQDDVAAPNLLVKMMWEHNSKDDHTSDSGDSEVVDVIILNKIWIIQMRYIQMIITILYAVLSILVQVGLM